MRHPIAELGAVGADRAPEFGRFRDHVVCGPGAKSRDADDGRLRGIATTRHDGLQSGHDLGGDDNRIHRLVWRRGMPAASGDLDREGVDGRKHGPRGDGDGSRRQIAPQVNPDRGVNTRILQDAVADHRRRSCAAFLRRLKRELDCTSGRETSQAGGNRESHRHVTVVSARVHHTGRRGGEWEARFFADREAVHISPDQYRSPTACTLQHAHDAGASHARRDRVAQMLQPFGDVRGRPLLLVS